MGIKDLFIKKYLGMKFENKSSDSITLKFSKKISIEEEFRQYDKLIEKGAKLLEGVENLLFNYDNNSIEIKYNNNIVMEDKVKVWAQVIIDILIKNMDFIKGNWENNLDRVVSTIEKELVEKRDKIL